MPKIDENNKEEMRKIRKYKKIRKMAMLSALKRPKIFVLFNWRLYFESNLSTLTQISYIYNQGEISNGELTKVRNVRLPTIICTTYFNSESLDKGERPASRLCKGLLHLLSLRQR